MIYYLMLMSFGLGAVTGFFGLAWWLSEEPNDE